jgi:thymidylate kinase
MQTANPVPVAGTTGVLPSVKALIAALDEGDVSYSLWKGVFDIQPALAGEDDLDLLVNRGDREAMESTLIRLNFKRVNNCFARYQHALEDYYGFDEASGRFIHLQIYYQLIFGQRLIENIHLPVESLLLNKSVMHESGLKIVSPEHELIVFVLRKYAQKGYLNVLRPGSMRRLAKDVSAEFAFLEGRCDGENLVIELEHLMPGLSADLFRHAMTLMTTTHSALNWLLTRRKLMAALSQYARQDIVAAQLNWLLRRVSLSRQGAKKQAVSGGLSIALIGSDGSGKSTAIEFLNQWLGSVFDVDYFHMGRPKPSFFTSIISRLSKALLPIACAEKSVGEAGELTSAPWPKSFRWLPKVLYCTVARDRYKNYQRIQKAVNKGKVALIDRFPIEEIKQMDCPRIHTLADEDNDEPSVFSRIEKSYYKKMAKPDLTILMVVDPETAAKRQAGDGYDYVIRRASEVQAVAHQLQDRVSIIDANQALVDVRQQLVRTCWARL